MYNLIATNLYLFIMAVVLALVEIQIEGPDGWAKSLPTWRPGRRGLFVRLYERLLGGKEMTGYHLAMFAFIALVFHLPFFFGEALTLTAWLTTLSLFFLFVILWDFLWFVLNPHYPLKRFKKEHIWWHKKWLGRLPVDYLGGIVISALLAVASTGLSWWLANVALWAVFLLLTILFTFVVLDIDHRGK